MLGLNIQIFDREIGEMTRKEDLDRYFIFNHGKDGIHGRKT